MDANRHECTKSMPNSELDAIQASLQDSIDRFLSAASKVNSSITLLRVHSPMLSKDSWILTSVDTRSLSV